jgi:sugar phosphate isomerase/epimerase
MPQLVLGVLTWSYHRQFGPKYSESAEAVIDKVGALAKEFGIRPMGIDFGTGQMRSTDPAYVDELKARLDGYGLSPMVAVGGLTISADRVAAEASLRNSVKGLETAARLGAKVAGFGLGWNGRVSRSGRFPIMIELIGRLAAEAKNYGLSICTENFDYLRPQEMAYIFEQVRRAGHANAGIQNDIGNWLITGDDPVLAAEVCNPYLVHVHARDYLLKNGVFTSVPIGRGMTDFGKALDVIRRAPVAGPITLSMETDLDEGDEDEAIRQCAVWMTDWFRKQGLPLQQ